MFEAEGRNTSASRNVFTAYSQNPYLQYHHRESQVSDIHSYINKAQCTTEAKKKFEIIAEIIKEFPVTAELTKFFTELLGEIFGLGNYQGWRLNSLNGKSRNDEILFKEAEKFLNPTGKLFQLIEKLLNENVAFDLPTELLPSNISESVQNDASSFFCAQKTGFVTGNQMLPSRKLNALEYYLFIFFSYIMQPQIRKEHIDWSGDVLYVVLFENYLTYFLPLETVPAQEPDGQVPSTRFAPSPTSEMYTKFAGASSRNKVDVSSIVTNAGIRPLNSWTWKSETFAQIFSDLWLSCRQQISARRTCSQDYYLPTDDQVTFVRIFVKHLHTFLNEKGSSYPNRQAYSSTTALHEDGLTGAIVLAVRKKLYLFLKNCFTHWPLGASFKMVLETWLSYIQPWRYQTKASSAASGQNGVADLSRWSAFIEDNLLFYSVLFRMFMIRAARLDLRALKDVEFIGRVAKVFSQANLAELLQEAEDLVLTPSNHSRIGHFPTQRLGSIYSAIQFPHKGIDLEDAGFQYEPLFDPVFAQQVEGFAQQMVDEAEIIKSQIRIREAKTKKGGSMGYFMSLFTSGSEEDDISHDAKLVARLHSTCTQLASIFKFVPPVPSEAAAMWVDGSHPGQLPKPFAPSRCYEDGRLLPEHRVEDDGTVVLTDRGIWQILQKMRHFDVQGKVPVDLEPIRSYEIPAIVRWLLKVSSRLNEKYREPLSRAYNSDGLFGKMLRRVSPRVFEHRGGAVRLPSSSLTERVRPRISLRFLGSYYTLYCLFWLVIIAKLFNLGALQFAFLVLLLLITFTLQNVVSSPVKEE